MNFGVNKFLGLNFLYASKGQMYSVLDNYLASQNYGYIVVTDVSCLVESQKDTILYEAYKDAKFIIPDSTILQKILTLKNKVKFKSVYYGVDLMLLMCELASKRKLKVGLFGGNILEDLKKIKHCVTATNPNIKIDYLNFPGFIDLETFDYNELIKDLNQSEVDVLFLGVGGIKQNKMMKQLTGKINCVCIGVGSAFDFLSGNQIRSPKIIHRLGLEWLYRLIKEPKRLYKRYLYSFKVFYYYFRR